MQYAIERLAAIKKQKSVCSKANYEFNKGEKNLTFRNSSLSNIQQSFVHGNFAIVQFALLARGNTLF